MRAWRTNHNSDKDDGAGAEFGEHSLLILAHILRTKLIGPAMNLSAEVLNIVQVYADGCGGEVAAVQPLHDARTWLVHREYRFSANRTIPIASRASPAARERDRRRRFVHVGEF